MKKRYVLAGIASVMLITLSVTAYASLGDVTLDHLIDADDAAEILVYAADIGAGFPGSLSPEALAAGDVNADGAVDAQDAAEILVYSAIAGSGGNPVFSGESSASSSDQYKTLYKNTLNKFSGSDCRYSLYDVDCDGIPELFISPDTVKQNQVTVYTCKDGELINLGDYGRYGTVYAAENYLMDYTTAKYSDLRDFYYFDGYAVYEQYTLVINYDYGTYLIDGTVITESEYNSYYAPFADLTFTELGRDYTLSDTFPIDQY